MANFPKMVLTSKGVSLQTKVQSGAELVLTGMALGDGQLGGTPISGLNALVSQKATLPLTGGKRVSTQTYQVEAFFSNSTIFTGFWWREWGVFATDPDVGEILYCYANAGDAGDYIAPATDTRIEKYLYASMAVGNASNITVEVSSSDIYITAQELAAHAEDTTKHIGTAAKTTPVDADALSLVDSADGNKLKRLTLANLKAALGSVFEPVFSKNSAFNKAFETVVSAIKMNGAASVGSSNNVARADHVHPVDTSRAAASHKSQHATGGTDALSPADIGAAPSAHTHDDRYFTEQETVSDATKALFGKLPTALPNDVFVQLSQATLVQNKKQASLLNVGDTFYLTENGVKAPFIKLKDNYESSGRTLVLRKDVISGVTRKASNDYTISEVDTYLSGTYLNSLAQNVKDNLANVSIPYTRSTGSIYDAISYTSRKVFALSLKELNLTTAGSTSNEEGTAITYFNSNAMRKSSTVYWTRTANKTDVNAAWGIDAIGQAANYGVTSGNGIRPALTLPANFEVEIDATLTDMSGVPLVLPGAKTATISYVGDGALSRSLTFPFLPQHVVIVKRGSANIGFLISPLSSFSYVPSSARRFDTVSFSGNTVSWGYSEQSFMLNDNGGTYDAVAVG